ncbi:MAG: hypothetical protein LBC27_02690 [Spirochaetaceae bacterium]|nr:hypothetical protein [Spirochaetaceae bacterium]
MSDAVLIAGAGAELIAALAYEAENRGAKTAVSIISGKNGAAQLSDKLVDEKALRLEWNPGSPISAQNLVLAAENKIGSISKGIIVCAAPGNAEAADFSPAGIDFLVNNYIKSYMFLGRELTRRFRTARNGTLVLALLEEPSSGLLAAPVFSAFKSFSNGLMTRLNPEYFHIAAFSCEEKNPPPPNEFAAYIFKTLAETKKLDGGRWFKFTKLKYNLKLA